MSTVAAAVGGASRADASPRPSLGLLLGFGAMVLGQFMAILDIQIIASSLADIQAGVGASADEISWVQTSYLIAEVVMIPLSGFLSRLWGTQKVFLASAFGFTVMSVATGLSNDITTMIVCRALQGFIGGAMIPTVFAVAFTAFPGRQRLTASVIIGLIVTLAPTVGPTLGGHISEWLSWRWLFFINVVPGIVVLTLVWRFGNFDRGDPSLAKGFDWSGLILMAVFLMSLQYVLEEGSKHNWFEEGEIVALSLLSALTGLLFLWRTLAYRQPIIELRAFADKNFALGVFLNFVVGAGLFGGTFILPLFLAQVRHYSSAEIGTTMVVSGLSMFFTAPLAGRFSRSVSPRLLMPVGFALVAYGFWLGHAVTKEWGFWQFAGLQAFRGVGVMVALIAAQNVTMSTLKPQMVKSASGLVNLMRNFGGAVGLAMIATALGARTAVHLNELSSRIAYTDGPARAMLAGLAERMAAGGSPDPTGAANKVFGQMLLREAATLAYGDVFGGLAVMFAVGAVVAALAAPSRIPAFAAPPSEAH